jgi:hypothetical protein
MTHIGAAVHDESSDFLPYLKLPGETPCQPIYCTDSWTRIGDDSIRRVSRPRRASGILYWIASAANQQCQALDLP